MQQKAAFQLSGLRSIKLPPLELRQHINEVRRRITAQLIRPVSAQAQWRWSGHPFIFQHQVQAITVIGGAAISVVVIDSTVRRVNASILGTCLLTVAEKTSSREFVPRLGLTRNSSVSCEGICDRVVMNLWSAMHPLRVVSRLIPSAVWAPAAIVCAVRSTSPALSTGASATPINAVVPPCHFGFNARTSALEWRNPHRQNCQPGHWWIAFQAHTVRYLPELVGSLSSKATPLAFSACRHYQFDSPGIEIASHVGAPITRAFAKHSDTRFRLPYQTFQNRLAVTVVRVKAVEWTDGSARRPCGVADKRPVVKLIFLCRPARNLQQPRRIRSTAHRPDHLGAAGISDHR